MSRPLLPLAVLALLAACGAPDDAAEACALVGRFDAAVRAGDVDAARTLVTFDSRPAIDAVPPGAHAGKQPLTVLSARHRHGAVHVRVADPNEGGKEGVFVVRRENAELRVDLIASAALVAREIPLPGPPTRTVLRPLSPAERARAARLAAEVAGQPPHASDATHRRSEPAAPAAR
ncbi:MAG TPA: hypothetical protein VK081_14190 [Planctomycetota bacterium]|nr:hypothetical protein [Planctomycetota bacterium]